MKAEWIWVMSGPMAVGFLLGTLLRGPTLEQVYAEPTRLSSDWNSATSMQLAILKAECSPTSLLRGQMLFQHIQTVLEKRYKALLNNNQTKMIIRYELAEKGSLAQSVPGVVNQEIYCSIQYVLLKYQQFLQMHTTP